MSYTATFPKKSTARLFGGTTARAHEVEVKPELGGLRLKILAEHKHERPTYQFWSAGKIRIVDPADSGVPSKLTNIDMPMSRLILATHEEVQAIQSAYGINFEQPIRVGISGKALLGWFAAAMVTLSIAAYGGPRVAASAAPYVPYEWRHQLGRFVVDALTEGEKICTDIRGQDALKSIVFRLVPDRDLTRAISVQVVDVDQVNAFAAPGGMIVVYRQLIDEAENAEELAGVIAHELGHVIEGHPTSGTIRSLGMMLAAQVMLGGVDTAGAASAVLNLYEMSYSRKDELEADRLAAEMLRAASTDPKHLSSFFERMAEENSSLNEGPLRYLSSHPAWSERIAAVSLHRQPEKLSPMLTETQWRDLTNICEASEG
jgi:Zn-dependent protease with chaperone function